MCAAMSVRLNHGVWEKLIHQDFEGFPGGAHGVAGAITLHAVYVNYTALLFAPDCTYGIAAP